MTFDLEEFKKCFAKTVSECQPSVSDLENSFLLMKSYGSNLLQFDDFEPKVLPELAACLKSNDLMFNSLLGKISTEYQFHKNLDFKTIESPPISSKEINEVLLLTRILLQPYKSLSDTCYYNEKICQLAIYTRIFLLAIEDMGETQLKYLLNRFGEVEDFFYKCLAIKIYSHHFNTLEGSFWKWEGNPFFDNDSDFFQFSISTNDPLTYLGFLAELLKELLDKNKKVISEGTKKGFREKIFNLDKREKNDEYYINADILNNVIRGLIPLEKEDQKKEQDLKKNN